MTVAGQEVASASVDSLKPRQAYLNNLIKRHFPENRNAIIFELGCGPGALIYFARQSGYMNMTGVDGSPEQVAAARKIGMPVIEGDVLTALKAIPDDSLDVVVAFDVIEHFTRDELIPVVDEVFRVLKRDGGRWILHVPNGESPFVGRILYGDLTHEIAFTQTSLKQLLISSGFGRVECFEDVPVPHSFKSFARWIIWKMIRNMLKLYVAAETGDTRNVIFSQNLLAAAYIENTLKDMSMNTKEIRC